MTLLIMLVVQILTSITIIHMVYTNRKTREQMESIRETNSDLYRIWELTRSIQGDLREQHDLTWKRIDLTQKMIDNLESYCMSESNANRIKFKFAFNRIKDLRSDIESLNPKP